MTGDYWDGLHRTRPGLVDLTVPSAARVAEFLHGGESHFAADRAVVRALTAHFPGLDRIQAEARAFARRAVSYLAAEAGVRQFLDVGAGLVPFGTTQEVAQAIDPGCRIVYTDSDPNVLSTARAVDRPAPDAPVSCVSGGIADVDAALAGAAPALDLGRPVGILLLSTLARVPTMTAASRAVSSLLAAVPGGSYAVVYHLASDLDPAMGAAARYWNKTAATPVTLRSRTDVLTLMTGLELLPPGAVPVTEWRPDQAVPARPVPVHGLVARKP
jgi:S-adenosyl methyltransferase